MFSKLFKISFSDGKSVIVKKGKDIGGNEENIRIYYSKMIENNDIGALVAEKIWYDYECDRIINVDKKGLGVRATRKTKLAGNLMLKRYMENGWINIVDRRTIYELSRYEEVTPNVGHSPRRMTNTGFSRMMPFRKFSLLLSVAMVHRLKSFIRQLYRF